jgi:NADPH:quinone reductase-like Zn-dependent oxidoreductase
MKLMKAIVYHNYGSPDVLKLEEIEMPTAGDDEVLIKVRAASLNALDAGLLSHLLMSRRWRSSSSRWTIRPKRWP